MLDAFIKKGVRRILCDSRYDHTNEKNEDAITSLVFSPIRYMDRSDSLLAFASFLGERFRNLHDGKQITKVTLDLWPSKLTTHSHYSKGVTRTEPDLLFRLFFSDGSCAAVLGEMKWNWNMPPKDLEAEINREISAVQRTYHAKRTLVFGIVKQKKNTYVRRDSEIITWTEFHRRVHAALKQEDRDNAFACWASDICEFLARAELTIFNGFCSAYEPFPSAKQPIFYSSRNPGMTLNWRSRRFNGFNLTYGTFTSPSHTVFYMPSTSFASYPLKKLHRFNGFSPLCAECSAEAFAARPIFYGGETS